MPHQNFTWISFYCELSRKLLEFRTNRTPLLKQIYENPQLSPRTKYLHMQNGSPFPDIDPFSFFGIFNRQAALPHRRTILTEIKKAFGLSASLPNDFCGIPILNNQKSFYLLWDSAKSAKNSTEEIWSLFESMMRGNAAFPPPQPSPSCPPPSPADLAPAKF